VNDSTAARKENEQTKKIDRTLPKIIRFAQLSIKLGPDVLQVVVHVVELSTKDLVVVETTAYPKWHE
jgi:hypothetical protein